MTLWRAWRVMPLPALVGCERLRGSASAAAPAAGLPLCGALLAACSKTPPKVEPITGGDIAGVLPHTTDNLIEWIRHPRQAVPNTAMPEPGVTEAEARDMAAYLYSH